LVHLSRQKERLHVSRGRPQSAGCAEDAFGRETEMRGSHVLAAVFILPVIMAGCQSAPTAENLSSSFVLQGRYGSVAQCAFLVVQARRTDWNVKLIDQSAQQAFQLLVASGGHQLGEATFLDTGSHSTRVEIGNRWPNVQRDIGNCAQR